MKLSYGKCTNYINMYTKYINECRLSELLENLGDAIKGIYANEKEKVVVVKWFDNTITKAKCCEGDSFDLYTGVAIALCKKTFGSNNKFKKKVDSIVKYMNK